MYKVKWYKEFGYRRNPLDNDPLNTREDPIGYDDELDRLLYLIEAEGIALVEGPRGSGKTLLLGQVIQKFGGSGKIIYVDGDKINRRISISELLIGNQGIIGKLLKKKPRGMILLLDNSKALPRKTYELLQYYFDQGYLKSIIFTTDDQKKLEFPGSLFDRIGSRVIKTKPLAMEDAVELVLERLNQDLISKDQLEKIFVMSDKDMTRFLANVEKVLQHMAEEDLEDVDMKTITKVINVETEDEDDEDPEICLECGDELSKVGPHYRCDNCDLYCPACGVLIEIDDYECPSCGVQFEEEDE